MNVDGVQVCHLGDLGHVLNAKELAEIGGVDILISPIGGLFTIDPMEAARNAELMNPKVFIPMHFKTGKCGFPLAPVEAFLQGKLRVKQPEASEASFDKASLPEQMEIVVLTHAL